MISTPSRENSTAEASPRKPNLLGAPAPKDKNIIKKKSNNKRQTKLTDELLKNMTLGLTNTLPHPDPLSTTSLLPLNQTLCTAEPPHTPTLISNPSLSPSLTPTNLTTLSSLPMPNVLCHREFPLLKRTPTLLLPGLKAILSKRTLGQRYYPDKSVQSHFEPSLLRFEVKASRVAKVGSLCNGLFLKLTESPIEPSPIPIGVYTGRISSGRGNYHLDISNKHGQLIIDGTPDPNLPLTCFGMMNEDIYDHKYNVKINGDGTLEVIATIYPGDELLTRYGDDYDWNWLKEEALAALVKEIRELYPWVGDLGDKPSLDSIHSLARHPLHGAINDIINGRCWSENMHSATPSLDWTGPTGLAIYLTAGTTYEKYRFGGFGSGKIFPEVSIDRGKLARFSDSWNGVDTADISCNTLLKREKNDHIRSLRELLKMNRRYTGMRNCCRSSPPRVDASH